MVTEPIVKKLVGISLGFYRTIIVEEVHKIFVRIYSYLTPGKIILNSFEIRKIRDAILKIAHRKLQKSRDIMFLSLQHKSYSCT